MCLLDMLRKQDLSALFNLVWVKSTIGMYVQALNDYHHAL